MELFAIQCTTCRVRLKVNDESVIGDILACPKCGSMVQVVPPVGWQRTGEPVATEPSAPSGPAAHPRPEDPKHSKAAAAAPVVAPSIPRPPVARPIPAPSGATSAAPSAPPTLPAAPSLEPRVHSPVTPSAARAASPFATIAGRLQGEWLVWGGGLVGGIVLGASMWLVLAPNAATTSTTPSRPQVAARLEAPPRDASPSAVSPPTTTSSQPIAASPDQPSAADTESESTPAATQLADSTTSPGGDVATPPSDEPTPSDDVQPAPAADGSLSASDPPANNLPASDSVAAAPQATSEDRAPSIKLEPVPHVAARAETSADEPLVASSSADQAFPSDDAEAPAPANHPPVPTGSLSQDVQGVLAPEAIDDRLSGMLPKIRFVDVPLVQFVEFIGDFANLSIAIDDAALATVDKRRDSPVTVNLSDATARQALRAAVESLGLTCVVRNGQLVVTAARSVQK